LHHGAENCDLSAPLEPIRNRESGRSNIKQRGNARNRKRPEKEEKVLKTERGSDIV